MSFPRYPAYKPSGVEWLGEVPEHWTLAPLKKLLDIQNGSDYKAVEAEDGYPVIGSGGPFAFASQYHYDGESVLLGRKGTIDRPLYIRKRFWAVDTMYWSKIRDGAHGRFAFYTSQCIPFQYYSTNTALPSMTKSLLGSHIIAVPCESEQYAIATFLDHETAKIDALIAEQQRLIELLQEKRQAVISHAVTKGLNPHAPMKDSGVEWLGEVPEHWEVGALGYALSAIGDVDHYMPPTVAEGVPYVMTGDLEDLASEIDFTACKQISRNEYHQLCKKIKTSKGDLIVARYATIGTVSYVDLDLEFIVSYSCVTIRPKAEKAFGRFLFFCLKSDSFFQGIRERINTNTQGNVGIADLKLVKVALPPIEEQLEITEFLQTRTEEMGRVIQSSEAVIDLLQERRSALISAAVTGQIDVRGLVSEAVAA
jgi:type I restriction enzyme S subunit